MTAVSVDSNDLELLTPNSILIVCTTAQIPLDENLSDMTYRLQ